MFNRRQQLLITFGYEGARFRGLQPQPGLPTAGATLRERFLAEGQIPKALCFTARTDAGVHAIRNVATCWLKDPPELGPLLARLTLTRDDGLRNVAVFLVDRHVHARNIAKGKHYRYTLEDGCPAPTPHATDRFCVHPALDVAAMHQAAQALVGTHDFSAFRGRGCGTKDPRRTIDRIDVTRDSPTGGLVHIDVVGQSFLRHMVRIIAGTLAGVGCGWLPPEAVAHALAQGDRRLAGPTAPGAGLTLVDVLFKNPELITPHP